jgi:hypothetical protein
MIAPQRLNHGRWCGLALAAVYVPPDKNSEFETKSYAWKMSGFRCYGARGEAMAPSSLQPNDGAPHAKAERFDPPRAYVAGAKNSQNSKSSELTKRRIPSAPTILMSSMTASTVHLVSILVAS